MKKLICQNLGNCPIHNLYSESNSVSGRRVLNIIEFRGDKYYCGAFEYCKLGEGFTAPDTADATDKNSCSLIELLNNSIK